MLHRGCDTARLHAAHEGRGDATGQQRVFGVRLEVASAERRAVQVDGWRQQHSTRFGARFVADRLADALDEGWVPGCAQGGATRHARGGRGGVTRGRARKRRAAGSVRPVGDPHRRNTETRDRHGAPQVEPGGQAGLLVVGELGDERRDVACHTCSWCRVRCVDSPTRAECVVVYVLRLTARGMISTWGHGGNRGDDLSRRARR